MKLNELKALIKEELKKALKENKPAKAPSEPAEKPGPAVAPGKPDTNKPKQPRRPLGNPNVKPAPKAKAKMNENEKKVVDDIVKRFRLKKKNK